MPTGLRNIKTLYCRVVAYLALKSNLIVTLSAAFIFLCGLGYSFLLGSKLDFLDERDYLAIADNIAHKGMFSVNSVSPTAYRPPMYPAVLAAFIKLGSGIFCTPDVEFYLPEPINNRCI